VLLVTLVCCYAACWGPTKKWGVQDVHYHLWDIERGSNDFLNSTAVATPSALLPLVVEVDFYSVASMASSARIGRKYYYFWFFGYVAKLPFQEELDLPR
jgi:hypothetical protein